jgi:RES domain
VVIDALEVLPKGTRLWRVYSQFNEAPDRALAYNPNSFGRASPLLNNGVADPALYASIDSPQCALREFYFHEFAKKNPAGSVIPRSRMLNHFFVQLEVKTEVTVVSIPKLIINKWEDAQTFSDDRTDYETTQSIAKKLLALSFASGLIWTSARAPRVGVNVVLFESRMKVGSLAVVDRPQKLVQSSAALDYCVEYLAQHEIRVGARGA